MNAAVWNRGTGLKDLWKRHHDGCWASGGEKSAPMLCWIQEVGCSKNSKIHEDFSPEYFLKEGNLAELSFAVWRIEPRALHMPRSVLPPRPGRALVSLT